ncbi:MAG: putative bifunctional diguanylate cyclase/phosphodiesterase [Gammaproteobacteria bacterium]
MRTSTTERTLRALWSRLTAPGYLTVRFKSARSPDVEPEFLGLNEPLVAQRVLTERVRVFADRSFEGALTAPLGSLLLAWIGGSQVGWSRSLAWLAAFALVEILIGRAGQRYSRDSAQHPSLAEQGGRLIILNFFAGLVWGSSVWVFWSAGHFEAYLLNLVILVGVAGLSLLVMSPFLGAMVSYFGGLLLLPAVHAFSLSHPLALKLAVGLVIMYVLMLQFGSAVGLHLLSDIEAKVRSRLLAERLRLALGAARQDWFDLNAESGEMTSSNRHVGIGSEVTTREERGYRQWLAEIHPDDRRSASQAFGAALDSGDAADVEYRLRRADGSWSWIRSTGQVVERDADGHALRVIGIHSDISEAKAVDETIRRLAFHDHLTQLPNRRMMSERLQQAVASAGREGSNGALMLLDMDDFKTLNDTLGHDVGDQFLKEVADRLRRSVRASDTVGRQGGDEYVVLLENLGSGASATARAETVASHILQSIREPYLLNLSPVAGAPQTYAYHCSASIGVTLFTDDTNSVDEIYKQADTAMYEAKSAGRNGVRFFHPNMLAEVAERAAIANQLREAVAQRQFVLYFQPQVDALNRTVGCEALLRWQHPVTGIATPDRFISIAEATGLILPLGRWVIEEACAQLVTWSRQPQTAHLDLSVNISAAQFRDKDFVEHVALVLATTGAPARRLKFEITESLAMSNVEEVIEKMSRLRAMGVGFSLDDFGTGYSSLAYLRRLPIEQLKIDRSFVRDALNNANDAVITKTIVALANAMGLAVVAEGVETAEHRDFLAAQGCRLYQGYFFARPMGIERFTEFLSETPARDSDGPSQGPLANGTGATVRLAWSGER